MEELKTFAQREQEKAQMGDTEFKYVHDYIIECRGTYSPAFNLI